MGSTAQNVSTFASASRSPIAIRPRAGFIPFPRAALEDSLVARFEQQARHYSERIAVKTRDAALSYAALNQRANQIAHAILARRGSGMEPVALLCGQHVELIAAILGVLKAGTCYLPLDPAHPAGRSQMLVADAGATLIVADTDHRSLAQTIAGTQRGAALLCLDEIEDVAASDPQLRIPPEAPAYIFYTSGTTGKPKGVVDQHRNVLHNILRYTNRLAIDADDGLTLLQAPSFSGSVSNVFGALLNGATLFPYDLQRDGLDGIAAWLNQEPITIYHSVPAIFRSFLTGDRRFPRIRLIRLEGDQASKRDLELYKKHFSPDCLLVNGLGATECGIVRQFVADHTSAIESATLPIGYPSEDMDVLVVDAAGEPVPPGTIGEIVVESRYLALGYWNNPVLTAEAFRPAAQPGTRRYHTGDLGRLQPDGCLLHLGRKNFQAKIRGHLIDVAEVEAALLRIDGVAAAVALVREDEPGEPRLVAYVVGEPRTKNQEQRTKNSRTTEESRRADGWLSQEAEHPESTRNREQAATLDAAGLRAALQDQLPDYMIPSAYVFLPALPLNENGKIDRRALPQPDRGRPDLAVPFVAPRSDNEQRLAQLWSALLKLEQIGVDDNFFDLGGHSLLAAQLIIQIRETFGVALPPRSIFDAPTIAEQAVLLTNTPADAETVSMRPVERDGSLPLSFAQERLLFIDQFEEGSSAYNVAFALWLRGRLDIPALKRSLTSIVERHELLRTCFPLIDGRAQPLIQPPAPVPLPEIVVEGASAEERAQATRQLARVEAAQPFDLQHGPLLRATLYRLDQDTHALLLTMHHLISDDWSLGVLYRELSAYYAGYLRGDAVSLPALPIQYADYAHWQRRALQGAAYDAQLSYWRQQLSPEGNPAPALLELPTDRPRPAVRSSNGATHSAVVPAAIVRSLIVLGQRSGTTLFMTTLAAFGVLLQRYSGQDDLVIGTPVANRAQAEIANLIGFFVNTLPLRTRLDGDPTFLELLQRVREVTLGGYAHQQVALEHIIETLQLERNPSYTPLFQVVFTLQNEPIPSPQLPELAVEAEEISNNSAKFDLTLRLSNTAEGLLGCWEYNRDLFDASTIERMAGHFQMLLAQIADDPGRRIMTIPLLTQAELDQIKRWSTCSRPYPRDATIQQLFEEQAARTPDAIAVQMSDQRLSYRELNRRANQLARRLRQLGVGADTLVGIAVERSPELLVGLLAILKAGGAYLPLDPDYPEERLRFMIADTGATVLLAQERSAATLARHFADVIRLDRDWPSIAAEDDSDLDSRSSAEHLAYVMYTSGSTGQPKGVSVPHRGVIRLVKNSNYLDFGPEQVLLQLAPVAFDASTFEIWGALLNGGRLALYPAGPLSFDELEQALAEYQVTTIWLTTGLFHQIVEERLDSLRHVRRIFAGGDVISLPHVRKILAGLPQTQLTNFYGPTENTTFSTFHPIDRLPEQNSVPIGRPIANTQVYILDRQMQPVPIGVPGEIYVGGDGLARGYLKRPALTAERFVPDPLSHPEDPQPGARLYKTGDLARFLPDGAIEFLGRIDTQVKVRGFRIELDEIQVALLDHPAVRDAVVIAREDHGTKRLVAYLVENNETKNNGTKGENQELVARRAKQEPGTRSQEPQRVPGAKNQAVPSSPAPAAVGAEAGSAGQGRASELRAFLQARLPDYMVPALFVFLPALPLNPNGKVDRKALPAPDHSRPELDEAYIAPTTRAEQILAEIWQQVLGLEQVGVHDNFFSLGGDSILSIQIMARANQAGLKLTPKQLFTFQTIAELAAVAGTVQTIQAEQGIVTGPVPLTPIQRWFFEREMPELHQFNQAMLLELRETIDPALLARSIDYLLRHHDALRLRCQQDDDGWQQWIAPPDALLPLNHIDLSMLSQPEQAAAIERSAAELIGRLHLTSGPLLQVALFELGADVPQRLLIVLHHLAVDGVSWRLLLEDLEHAYRQLMRDGKIALPAKTTSFKQWSERLSEYAQSPELRQELPYWLATAANFARLPVDEIEPGAASAHEPVVSTLDQAETNALLHDVPAAYRTQINDVLLAALAHTISEWTGEHTLLVHLEGHGREALFDDVDLSRTVGWFTTSFPLCLDLGWSDTLEEQLKRVKEQLRQLPQRGIGYGMLRYLSRDPEVGAALQALPHPEISLNYLGQYDQVIGASELFGIVQESDSPYQSMRGSRSNLIEINGLVIGGRLQLEWTYDEQIHRPATIARLARRFEAALRSLIAGAFTPAAVAYTPSDFPLAHLDEDTFNDLAALLEECDEG